MQSRGDLTPFFVEKGGEISMTTAAKLIEKGKLEGKLEG
jgi:hypothetical protein